MSKVKTVPSSLREIEEEKGCSRCDTIDSKNFYKLIVRKKNDIIVYYLCDRCTKDYLDKENEFKIAFVKDIL